MTRLLFLSLLASLLILSSCDTYQPSPSNLTEHNFIPKPTKVTSGGSSFRINDQSSIVVSDNITGIGNYLKEKIQLASGISIPVETSSKDGKTSISLSLDPIAKGVQNDGYVMDISESKLTILAITEAGLFNGVQTLNRLLPLAPLAPGEILEIPTGSIIDNPNFGYRGSMLDVSRHFFSVADVKRYIDLISMYKMNVLHLHLSDDQGWRIEIKSWPNLTAHGSQSEVGGGEGGFYTQEEYKEIVAYAGSRYITIIPEIDLPGHTNAALSSYPELNCDGIAPAMRTDIEVGYSTLCVRKDITYKFVDDVIKELVAMTPGPYIHIGGDESHVTEHDDYVFFVNKVQDIVNKYGKQMIGWDEVANADLKSQNVAQHWAFKKQAQSAVAAGAKVIISPARKAYMDMKYDSTTVLGLKWANTIEVDTSYMWNPENIVPGIDMSSILGVEAPLWSETISNMDDIEYMAFPRLASYAELGWTNKSQRSWDDFKVRLGKEQSRYEAMDINFYKSPKVPWVKESMTVSKVKN